MTEYFVTGRGVKQLERVVVNKQYKYDARILEKAIRNGMVLLIRYRGDGEPAVQGRERVIQPMAYGISSKNKGLIRAWHLRGWSLSAGGEMSREWRLFRTDRIKSMTFTGTIFTDPPPKFRTDGGDKSMKRVIYYARPPQIKTRMMRLKRANMVASYKDVIAQAKKHEDMPPLTLKVEDTRESLDLTEPWNTEYVNRDEAFVISFMEPVNGGELIAVFGSGGGEGREVVLTDGIMNIGNYIAVDTLDNNSIDSAGNINGQTDFRLYNTLERIRT